MHECNDLWFRKRMNGRIREWMLEWEDEWRKGGMNEWMNEWMRGRMSQWMRKIMNGMHEKDNELNAWMREWNAWMNERIEC